MSEIELLYKIIAEDTVILSDMLELVDKEDGGPGGIAERIEAALTMRELLRRY